MGQYLLSVHTNGKPREPMSAAEVREGFARIAPLEAEMKSSGALVYSGRLLEPQAATVVRMTDGKVLTTDGPFIEAKEVIAGFYIIEAEDLDSALEWAAKTTAAINAPIEVRPFWSAPAG